MTKVIKGDWVMEKDEVIDDHLVVEGNIYGKDGQRFNLTCMDLKCKDLNCRDLNCRDLKCWDLNCRDLKCWDLNCMDLNCLDLKCRNLNCLNCSYYAVAFAYKNMDVKSIKGSRENSRHFVLDGEIKINPDKEKTE